jgi:hypothetical protein
VLRTRDSAGPCAYRVSPSALVSVERRRDIEIGMRLGNQTGVRLPFLFREPIHHSVGRLCPAWISAVFDKPLLGEGQIRLRDEDVAGTQRTARSAGRRSVLLGRTLRR